MNVIPLEATIEHLQNEMKGSRHEEPCIKVKHAYAELFKFRGWEIPNVYVMYQAYRIHKEMK